MRIAMTLALVALCPLVAVADDTLTGTYLEARSASVFAGACHYNGEFSNAGRKITMAFDIESGSFAGVSLAGVHVVAVVTASDNLDIEGLPRSSVIYVDEAATPAQQKAVVAAIRHHAAYALGEVLAVKTAPIRFDRTKTGFDVRVEKHVVLKVEELPDRACCNMPSNVWYKPFVKISDRLVGCTVTHRMTDATLGLKVLREDENSAFYGTFTLPAPTRLAKK